MSINLYKNKNVDNMYNAFVNFITPLELNNDSNGIKVVTRSTTNWYLDTRDFSIFCGVYDATREIVTVLELFKTVITNAQKEGASCPKVVCFDYYSHLPPEKINAVFHNGATVSQLFAATASDESLIPISNDPNPLHRCCTKAWEAIFPVFAKFLDSTYGIRCTERKQTPFVDRYYAAHCNDNPSAPLIDEIKRPKGGQSIDKFEWSYITQRMEKQIIADKSELRTNSHEYILSWKKSWEPEAFLNYPFPECATSNTLTPNNMKFLFDDCTKRQFTDVEIACRDGTVLHTHRLILVAAGDYFKTMLTQKMQEGLSNKISFSEYESKTVETFLKFLYLEQDPFAFEDVESIDAQQLLALAHLCQIERLTRLCTNYIGKNVDESQWKEVGQLGADFQNKYLLEVYEYYRNRKGKLLPEEMRIALQKYAGINLPPSPCAKALVHCDVGYGNSLGLFCHPHWDADFPSRFIWTEAGWKGHVPVNTDFKFVLINSNNTIKWENRPTDRREKLTSKSIAYNDLKF